MRQLSLWPLWAAVLGIGLPAKLLIALDGWLEYIGPLDIAVAYATSLVLHTLFVAVVLIAAGLMAGIGILFIPRLQPTFVNACVVFAARALVLVVVVTTGIRWFEAVAGTDLPDSKIVKGLIVLLAAAVALASTRRNRQPGPLLQLGRTIAIASVVISVALVGFQAIRGALDASPAPRHASIDRQAHPDVVLITIDALSAPHMSLYGNTVPTSPNIDRFANDHGVVFDRFYANANYTTPGVASIVFGSRPWDHRSIHLPSRALERTRSTNLLKSFHDAGYQTLTVDTNIWASPAWQRLLPWVDQRRPVRINQVDAHIGRLLPWMPGIAESEVHFGWYRPIVELADQLTVKLGLYATNTHFLPELAFSDARRMWAEAGGDTPRFLWVHLLPPHDPYSTPAPFLGMFDPAGTKRSRFDSVPPYRFKAAKDAAFPQQYVGRYHESIAYVDHHVGGFLDWLRQDGSFDASLIVISADHGESFSHGYGGHTGPLLTEELIHVPLIVKLPGNREAGTHVSILADQQDLAPTLVGLAGLSVDAGYRGRALRLDGGAPQPEAAGHPVFSMNFERANRFAALTAGSVAMLQGPYKYVHYLGLEQFDDYPPLRDALFDVVADPKESRDLMAEQPQKAAEMLAAIQQQLATHGGALK
ncbi:MAG: sulfatase family protein [Panacagrimonas sp.]